jgi:O-methyltransferase
MDTPEPAQTPAALAEPLLAPANDAAELYLDLLKRCLTRTLHPDPYQQIDPLHGTWKRLLYVAHLPLKRALAAVGVELVRHVDPTATRSDGRDHPAQAETMIGLKRLDNLDECISDVIKRRVSGDLLEAGVWRGGAAIFMRAALRAYGGEDRLVWAADSFRGLPPPDLERYPSDRGGDVFFRNPHLAISLEEVKGNFRRYGLLDERVRFLPGWFRDTLPAAPIERLAVLRLDGDLYESTIAALEALYDKVSPGGYVIVDDYFAVPTGAGKATDDFRRARGIKDQLVRIDRDGVFWKRRPRRGA